MLARGRPQRDGRRNAAVLAVLLAVVIGTHKLREYCEQHEDYDDNGPYVPDAMALERPPDHLTLRATDVLSLSSLQKGGFLSLLPTAA